MKYGKQILAAVLALVMVFALASCGSKWSTKDTAYAAGKVDSDGGTIAYAYDTGSGVAKISITSKIQTAMGNGTNINYGFVNYRDFDDVNMQNINIITGDNFITNPLFTSGKIDTLQISYLLRGTKKATAKYTFETNGKNQVTKAHTGQEMTQYAYGKEGIESISYYYADQSGKKDGKPYCIVKFNYDDKGRITSFTNEADSGYNQTRTDTFTVTYDSQGRVSTINGTNGSRTTYTYNAAGKPVKITSTGKMDAKSVTDITYDADGNIAKLSGKSSSLQNPGSTQTVTFSGYQKI